VEKAVLVTVSGEMVTVYIVMVTGYIAMVTGIKVSLLTQDNQEGRTLKKTSFYKA